MSDEATRRAMNADARTELVQHIAVALHHSTYGPDAEPNSPGFQALWESFERDATVAIDAICDAPGWHLVKLDPSPEGDESSASPRISTEETENPEDA